MPQGIERWLKLFGSSNAVVRTRAAAAMLDQSDDVPLPVLLEILDDHHDKGLGAKTERVLLERRDPDLLPEMINRLRSPSPFVRETASWVLRELKDRSATPHLLSVLDDKSVMVRTAAAAALAAIADPSSGPTLLQHYQGRRENINVRWALENALDALGIQYERRGP